MENYPDVKTETFIDYDTEGHRDPNRCTSDAIWCAETRTASALLCDADIIIEKPGNHFTITFHQPKCFLGSEMFNPTYTYNVDDLLFCKHAGAVGADGCGGNPELWQQKNGKAKIRNGEPKRRNYRFITTMTDGTVHRAKAKVTWTE